MTTTRHPGGIVAVSSEGGDLVGITIGGDAADVVVTKDVLIAIAAAHAAMWPEPKLGQSIYRSVDAQLVAMQSRVVETNAEADRLRRALEHVKALGDAATNVAGTPLSLYATAALNGATE